MSTIPISIDPEQIAGFCRRHHMERLSLFGSAPAGRLRP